ncbi:NACHT domain-containing protein [Streptomyces sp. NPDC047081]|uniref:NACHT domain-containing protein n=1 Tax=Streptomyces sp. NPDC047081 TaxID=3154706 RepID=UPI0033C13115
MAVGGGGHRLAWAGATCALVAGALAYALAGEHGPLGVSDRSGLVSMAVGLPALVLAAVAALWARPGAYEDETAAVARLVREVRSVGEPQWMLSLGGDLTAIDVTFAFRPYANARAATLPPTPAGQLERVVEDYRALRPRRLVITGEPGAGKTVLAWKLVMELNRTRTEREPVPVLMALADWDEEEPVDRWIARHLERDYGLPSRSARRLVAARMVLPVLDGLDEMDAADTPADESRARVALDALARYQDGTEPAPLVLTCRTRQYDDLEADAEHILDAARIEIDPVTPGQAVRFLEQRGAARRPAVWRPLLDELHAAPDGVVSRTLSTPWRLTLVATVYEREGDPGELLTATTATEAADLLLRRYIPAAVRQAAGLPGGCGADRAHRRLALLARALEAGGGAQADLRLRELSGKLGGRRPRNLLAGLVTGLGAVTVWGLAVAGSTVFNQVMITAMAVISPLLVLSERLRQRLAVVYYTPRLGSSLWRVGVRLAFTARGRRRWSLLRFVAVVIVYAVMVCSPPLDGWGGWREALPLAPLVLAMAVSLAVQWIDVAAIGPSGWARGGVFWVAGIGSAVFLIPVVWQPVDASLAFAFTMAFLALGVGCEWAEYALFLLTTPELPMRLARFLDWSVSAGLLRTSGIAYQFRHREFQEWLARNPLPIPAARSRPPERDLRGRPQR